MALYPLPVLQDFMNSLTNGFLQLLSMKLTTSEFWTRGRNTAAKSGEYREPGQWPIPAQNNFKQMESGMIWEELSLIMGCA